MLAFSKSANTLLNDIKFRNGDILLFGREDTGLPDNIKKICSEVISIPMPGGVNNLDQAGVRSLNLSSAVAIVAYQAISQSIQ